jgi:hypothetical protein
MAKDIIHLRDHKIRALYDLAQHEERTLESTSDHRKRGQTC